MDTLREAPFGQLMRLLSGGRLFKYKDELPGFVVPAEYLAAPSSRAMAARGDESPERRDSDAESECTATVAPPTKLEESSTAMTPTGAKVVDWYGPNDQDNPKNWSLFKKTWVVFVIMFYLISVYIGSAIFAYAMHDAAVYFKVSDQVSALNLSLFVFGYAVGPLFLAPISEISWIGRNPPYIISLFLFCILQVPSALADNLPGLLVLRFLAGFIGSPPLATGGASMTDMFHPQKASYAVNAYGYAGGVAPAIAPTISGFAVMAYGWRWSFWVLLMLSGTGFVVVFFGLPETFGENILYRRAVRLRKLTGDNAIKAESELHQKSVKHEVYEALIRPLWMSVAEPIVIALNIYIGLTYAVLYSYFESFPFVFGPKGYNWNLGVSGLPFLAIPIGGLIAYGVMCWWCYYKWEPQYVAANGKLAPEAYLPLSIIGAFCFPICLFWFGWTANRTHWISPVLASMFFGLGDCFSFMPYCNYLTYAYPNYAASALASNDFVRSLLGGAMPVVAFPLFNNLGIAWGSSLLGFLMVAFLPLPLVLIKYGPWLRSKSPMASAEAPSGGHNLPKEVSDEESRRPSTESPAR